MHTDGITVLSLFDGMSCGMIALDRLGIKVKAYYASEIDKHAIKVSKHNWPDIIHIGDVTKVGYFEGWLYNETEQWYVGHIDLLIGGSPCQGFSFAGKQLNFEDPRSKLFFEYVRLKEETQCSYFLLENVVMKKEYEKAISDYLLIEPVFINSALVSAQTRKRLYWSNIPYLGLPDNLNIQIKDILDTNCDVGAGRMVGRKINPLTGKRDDYNKDVPTLQILEVNDNPQKSNCLTSVQKDNILVKQINPCKKAGGKQPYIQDRVYHSSFKSVALTASFSDRMKTGYSMNEFRNFTVTECERLQTVPDNYTSAAPLSQRFKMLGNGWTVDVICHLLKPLLNGNL